MKQTEILAPGPLLDSEGQLRRPGYSKTYVQTYDRKAIRVSPLRILEPRFHLARNGNHVHLASPACRATDELG